MSFSSHQNQQRRRVLDRLREGPANTPELNDVCFRFGARIFELRKDGYSIKTRKYGRGLAEYTLISEPASTQA